MVNALEPRGLREVDQWLDRFRHFWAGHLEALATGKRKRRKPLEP
jgi:hypothetical protein